LAKIKFKIRSLIIIVVVLLLYPSARLFADVKITDPLQICQLKIDSDNDGLIDNEEINIYRTDPNNQDSDGDGYSDGAEIKFGFDPNRVGDDKLEKRIVVALADQSLSYFLGDYTIGSFEISSGLPNTPTPSGEYQILKKIPVVEYKGFNYDYKNTRWNMMFKQNSPLNYYIHGAYWHNNFGSPMSHGCINVSYSNIEALYNWSDLGTKVVIK
jgi:lipoprotein-anchoring transpeptidase ErfK/SrfK